MLGSSADGYTGERVVCVTQRIAAVGQRRSSALGLLCPSLCAVLFPSLTPCLFSCFSHPQLLYPGLGCSAWLIVPHFLGLLGSCAGISCTSAAGAEGVVSQMGLRGLGIWDAR